MTEKELQEWMDELFLEWTCECKASGTSSASAREIRRDYLNAQAEYRALISSGNGDGAE